MSIQPISGASAGTQADNSSVETDFQVKQLESQIKDWTTCPTTPPATKKVIVAKLQAQLDTVKSGLENKQRQVQAANKQSAQSAANVPTQGQPTLAPRYVPPFKVDTYV